MYTIDMGFPTSLSTPDVSELDRKEFMTVIHSSSKHSILAGSLFNQLNHSHNKPSPFTITFNSLKSRFLHLKRRVRSLEVTNSTLKADNSVAHGEIALLTDELQATRVNLYHEIESRRKDASYIEQADKKITDFRAQVKRYGAFVSAMAKLGVDNPLYCASLSVMSKVEAEDALVDSIMEAAKDKRSPWSRIIPAVIGPRSPEQYVSAINLTLQTRQDLRDREKVCQFWKTTAKQDPQNSSLLTPSSSELSDLNLGSKRKTTPKPFPNELEDMLGALKSGAIKTSLPIPHPEIEEMEEWLESELNEESFPSSSGSSQDNDRQLEPSSSFSIPSETAGILKKADTAGKIAKIAILVQQRVRFDLDQDDKAEVPLVSAGTSSSSLSDNLDVPDSVCHSPQSGTDDTDDDTASFDSSELSPSRTTVTLHTICEQPHMSPATSSALPNHYDADVALQESTDDTASTVEEYSIVEAGGNVPQVLIHLKAPFESCLQPSLSDYGISSSGSEYSELSADYSVDEQMYARRSPLPPAPAFASDAEVEISHQIPRPSEQLEHTMNETSEPRQSSAGYATTEPASVWPSPRAPEMISRDDDAPLTDDASGQRERSALQIPQTPPRPKPSSRLTSPSPSSPTKTFRTSAQTKFMTSAVKLPTRRNVAPVASKNALPKTTSRVSDHDFGTALPDMSSRSTSPIQRHRQTLKRPSPSRLAVPQVSYGKRPALQRVDVNTPIAHHSRKASGPATAGRDESDPFMSHLAKAPAPAKDLSKRRGVIMMENLNIESTLIEGTPKPVRGSMVVPNICEMEISAPPRFIPSVSSESVGLSTMDPSNTGQKIRPGVTLRDISVVAPQLDGAGSRLQSIEHNTSLDSSSYENEISELVASMSNSDLGSLEMTDESDSETLGPVVAKRSTLNALPRVCKDIMDGPSSASRNGRSSDDSQFRRVSPDDTPAVSSSLFSRLRPQRLISATFGSSPSSESMHTSSSTSSSSSSALLDSPTRTKSIISQSSRLGLGHRPTRSGGSSMPTKLTTPASVVKSAMPAVLSQPRPLRPLAATHAALDKSGIPSPQTQRPLGIGKPARISESTSKGKERAQERHSIMPSVSKNANKTSTPKQHKGTADPSPTRETKAWMGQGIFSRFTKSSSATAQATEKTSKSHLSPNGSAVSPVKPRSNTINTITPSFQQPSSRPAHTLELPSPSTKPRSNTVNTYSPVTRSPLSQHVTNNSVDSQSRSSIPVTAQAALSLSSAYPSKPKSVTPSKIVQPTGKSVAPLRYVKKTGIRSSTQDSGPAPPTAAFMIQSRPVVRTGRRIDSSVTPLIPSSANGVISPSQCRSLLRNTLSLAVR